MVQLRFVHFDPGWVAHLVRASPCMPAGCRFEPWSGHIPRLWVRTPVGACKGGNQSMFLSHIYVSLFLSLPSSFSKIYKHILSWGLKKWLVYFVQCKFNLKKETVYKYWTLVWTMHTDVFRSKVFWCLQLTLKYIKEIKWLELGCCRDI